MKNVFTMMMCAVLACAATAMDLGGAHLKGRPPETLITCGGGAVWTIDPDGKVLWRKDGCGNIHRAIKRGDKVYWSNGNIWVTEISTGKTELFYFKPAKREGTYGFDITKDGTMVVAENATDFITEMKLDTKEVVTRFKGDPRDAKGKMPGGHHHYRMVSKTDAGTYLVCCSGAHIVREYDAKGCCVKSLKTPCFTFDAVKRPNGNIVVSHVTGLTEYAPDGQAVWTLKPDDLPGLGAANFTALSLQPNGNLVVGTWANGASDASRAGVFEVTPEKRVVWALASSTDINMMSAVKLTEVR